MTILLKETKNYGSLIYLMADKVPVECHIATSADQRDNKILDMFIQHFPSDANIKDCVIKA